MTRVVAICAPLLLTGCHALPIALLSALGTIGGDAIGLTDQVRAVLGTTKPSCPAPKPIGAAGWALDGVPQ